MFELSQIAVIPAKRSLPQASEARAGTQETGHRLSAALHHANTWVPDRVFRCAKNRVRDDSQLLVHEATHA
jgi:hypothetical protein